MEHYIMLIDDDSDEYMLVTDVLSKAQGVKCHYACNARIGLELMRKNPPSLVLLDMNMPEMNGLECLLEMKRCDILSQTPVVIYSTCVTDSLSSKAAKNGALACLKKPHTMPALRELLHDAFKLAGLPDLLAQGSNRQIQHPRRDGYWL